MHVLAIVFVYQYNVFVVKNVYQEMFAFVLQHSIGHPIFFKNGMNLLFQFITRASRLQF